MKRFFTKWQLAVLALIAVTIAGCKREQLADVLSKENYPAVGITLPTKLDIGTGATYTVNAGDVVVPITISFSAPTTRAFSVNLATNVDTVAALVTAGTLPAGTAAFTPATSAVPQVITIPIGVNSYTVNLSVSRSFMELNYGKNIAVVVKASNADKGNKFATGKSSTIVLVKSGEVLNAGSVHVISFGTPSNTVSFPSGAVPGTTTTPISAVNYVVGSESITFNIPIKIQGDLGTAFTVDAVSVPDSVTKYINNGTLANTVVYPDSKISIQNARISFAENAPTAVFTFTTKTNTLLALQPAIGVPSDKFQGLAFKLQLPSKFQVAANNTIYLKLDVNAFRPYYGTPFLIKGAINAVSDPIYCAYYDFGGEGIGWHDDTGKDGDGGWRAPDYVDVVGDYTPRSVIGWNNNNEWQTYSMFVEQSGTYQIDNYMGSSNSNGRFSVYIDGVIVVNNKTAPQTSTVNYGNQLPVSSTITLTAGFHIMRFFFNVGSMDVRGAIFTRKS